jgi:hypothetical protein
MTSSPNDRFENFATRLVTYHDISVDDVLELIDYLHGPEDTVVVGGSLALGLGNRLSDLDVVICGQETSPSRVPIEHWVKTLRVDVWPRSHEDIERLFAQAELAIADEAPIAGAFGSVDEEQQLKLLHRVASGMHIAGPRPLAWQEGDYGQVARDLVVREYAERMRESACVAHLAIATGHIHAAGINARLSVEESLHAALAAGGIPFSGDKWLQERLREDAPELWERYRPFASIPREEEKTPEFVEAAVALCEHVSGLDLTLERLLPTLTWSGRGLRVFHLDGAHMLNHASSGALYRLDDEELAAWSGLEEAGEAQEGEVRWKAACEPQQQELLMAFYIRGLVEPRWASGIPLEALSPVSMSPIGSGA